MFARAVWFEASRKEGPFEDMFFSRPVHAFAGIGGCPQSRREFLHRICRGIKKLSAILLANSFD
ncbi:hypothetical protein GFL84_00480 [Rhizobium leguminosarum bv. viciae]|nr:hypothetical protein [Rhizobium leguminosarum bv. viciae]NKM75846.1 hypothetical protein [Rhizobium leguminosarum bv. viciae]